MEKLSPKDQVIWSCWKLKTPREVVREAAAKGTYIQLAHKYLMHMNCWDEETAKQWFLSEVCTWVLILLTNQQFFKASHVLTKIQMSPNHYIFRIAKDSAKISLRDYLVEQLKKNATDLQTDSPENWKSFCDHWYLLQSLEKSFGALQNKAFGAGKNIFIVNESEMKQLTIAKIETYSWEWKVKVAVNLYFDSFDSSLIIFLDHEQVWRFLIEKNKVFILCLWLHTYFTNIYGKDLTKDSLIEREFSLNNIKDIDAKKITLENYDDIILLFKSWKIDSNMLQMLKDKINVPIAQELVHVLLSCLGIFQPDITLEYFIEVLTKAGNVHNINNILVSSTESLFNAEKYYRLLFIFCEKNDLFTLLSYVIDDHVLDQILNDSIDHSKFPKTQSFWYSLRMFFNDVQNNTKLSNALFKTCELLAVQGTADYFTENPLLLLAIIIIGRDTTVFNIFKTSSHRTPSNFTLTWNENIAQQLPHMNTFYKKYECENLPMDRDIDMYCLLIQDGQIDVPKVFHFRFQQHDKFCLNNTYISPENLMLKFGVPCRLDHKYYLKQSRACFASHIFILDQIEMSNKNKNKYLSQMTIDLDWEALREWSDPLKTMLHVAFMSMIDADSSQFRLKISVANVIYDYFKHTSSESELLALKEEVTRLLNEVGKNKLECSESLGKLLSDATHNSILKFRKDTDLSDIIYKWLLPVIFSRFHELPLPENIMREFASKSLWFPFLLFGDIFMYSQYQMLDMLKDFPLTPSTLHLQMILRQSRNEHCVLREHHSNEKITLENEVLSSSIVESNVVVSDDLWEILAYCNSPDDPPGELIKASTTLKSPLLALMALCYEPNAVGVCWANWILTSLDNAVVLERSAEFQWDISDQYPTEKQFYDLIQISIEAGCVKMLHESFITFFPSSPLCYITEFAHKTARQLLFDDTTADLIWRFKNDLSMRDFTTKNIENQLLPYMMKPLHLQKISVNIILTNLFYNFISPLQQVKYLDILRHTEFESGLLAECPCFMKLKSLLDISIRSLIPLDLKGLFKTRTNTVATEYIENLISIKEYNEAREFALCCDLSMDAIVLAEWSDQLESKMTNSRDWDDKSRLHFCVQCCVELKNSGLAFTSFSLFMKGCANQISDNAYKFYVYRLLYLWAHNISNDEENVVYRIVELDMWNIYFSCKNVKDIYLGNFESTVQFVRSMDTCVKFTYEIPRFNQFLSEIELSYVVQHSKSTIDMENVCKWTNAVTKLLESNMANEAWRLSEMFSFPEEYLGKRHVRLKMLKTSLMLAENTLSPYDIPVEMRLVISPTMQTKLECESSEMSIDDWSTMFTKSVEDTDNISLSTKQLDVDRLAALESLATRGDCPIGKQVLGYSKIATILQLPYEKVLKYNGDPLVMIDSVTGKPRMSLAKIIFKVFNVPPVEVAEYLCNEMVASLLAPHLSKTAGLHNKAHIEYILWGFFLNSNIEMFINMIPKSCSALGEFMIDYLTAIRRIYKDANEPMEKVPKMNFHHTDIESVIDEEYQNVDENEVLSHSECNVAESAFECEIDESIPYHEAKLIQRDRNTLFDIIDGQARIPKHIMVNIRKITKGAKLTPKQLNVLSIEIMIIAHECFTAVCDVEGVLVVLRSAQILSTRLVTLKSWRLLVRLVTGIGRYTEMSYVFRMLQENHQFEFLLGQFDYVLGHNEAKIIEFKQGILEYLTAFCPEDEETYCMVASHFSMYSEVAFFKRKKIYEIIYNLKDAAITPENKSSRRVNAQDLIVLENNDKTRALLQNALSYSYDAAELLFRECNLKSADDAAQIVHQLSLQISLLKEQASAVCILDLNKEQISIAISKYLTFMDGLILAEATDSMNQWFELVYSKVLTAKVEDEMFLEDLGTYRVDVAERIITRYQQDSHRTPGSDEIVDMLYYFIS